MFVLVLIYIWPQEEKTGEKTSPPASGAPQQTTAPAGVAKENGMKEPTLSPFGGDGLKEPLSIDKRIAEKSACQILHSAHSLQDS